MINILTGKKGSGKTKHLISLAHEAVKVSKGHVVCVEKGDTLTYDVDHKARLINIEDYNIGGFDALYGFICGLCACNYDITDILVDSTLKIGGRDFAALADFMKKIAPLSTQTGINFTFSVSADIEELPEEMLKVVKKL
ncbi:MAG: hypothetical protein E7559_03440 [Ruminococcaceae bacterium]|nr:hypothetical protein [Oscillospiraceae bacterium]